MNGLAEVIPINSRRRKVSGEKKASETTAPALRRRLIACGVGLLVLVVGLAIVDRAVSSPARFPPTATLTPELRRPLQERAMADVAAACSLPEAASGLLRQHCVEQARFLSALPECNGDCERLSRAVLSPTSPPAPSP
jgi:hypothetical protein